MSRERDGGHQPQRGSHGLRGAAPKQGPADRAKAAVVTALGQLFNLLALNLTFLLVALPVVTLPVALDAAARAIDRWQDDGEERVVREFFRSVCRCSFVRTTITVGVPLVAMLVGVEEVHYFARGGSPASWICLGLGTSGLLTAVSAFGYVLLLERRAPGMGPAGVWSASVGIAVHNVFTTGPLCVLEIGVAVVLGLVDPFLLLLGLPIFALVLLRMTTRMGLRRAEAHAGAGQ